MRSLNRSNLETRAIPLPHTLKSNNLSANITNPLQRTTPAPTSTKLYNKSQIFLTLSIVNHLISSHPHRSYIQTKPFILFPLPISSPTFTLPHKDTPPLPD